MRIITLVTQKGGTGKATIAASLLPSPPMMWARKFSPSTSTPRLPQRMGQSARGGFSPCRAGSCKHRRRPAQAVGGREGARVYPDHPRHRSAITRPPTLPCKRPTSALYRSGRRASTVMPSCRPHRPCSALANRSRSSCRNARPSRATRAPAEMAANTPLAFWPNPSSASAPTTKTLMRRNFTERDPSGKAARARAGNARPLAMGK